MIPDLANLASIGSHVIALKPFGPRIDQRDPLGKKLGADIIAEKAMQKLAGGGLTIWLMIGTPIIEVLERLIAGPMNREHQEQYKNLGGST